MTPTAYHQIGRFIVTFQHIESAVNDILVLLAGDDSETVSILVNELAYAQRLKTVDVMLARIVELQRVPDVVAKDEFHKLIVCLGKLGERRNAIVHSKYHHWRNIQGSMGLIRQNSILRSSLGKRVEDEEELQPESFNADFAQLDDALQRLEVFRLKAIDWRYPVIQ